MDFSIIWKGLLVIGLAAAGIASRFLLKRKPDNQIEELAEAAIKSRTGIDIDLSSDSPDKEVDGKEMVREATEWVAEIRTGSNKKK